MFNFFIADSRQFLVGVNTELVQEVHFLMTAKRHAFVFNYFRPNPFALRVALNFVQLEEERFKTPVSLFLDLRLCHALNSGPGVVSA